MGGGNAQKSAMSRSKNADKAALAGRGGGGAAGMEKRSGGDMGSAMAIAQVSVFAGDALGMGGFCSFFASSSPSSFSALSSSSLSLSESSPSLTEEREQNYCE